MEKKHTGWALVVVAVIAVVLGWPYLSWFRFELDVRDAISDKRLGRFPTPDQILELRATLTRLAKKKGFEELQVDLVLEERTMGPTTFWFLRAVARSGGHQFVAERRIETKLESEDLETLAENEVEVKSG